MKPFHGIELKGIFESLMESYNRVVSEEVPQNPENYRGDEKKLDNDTNLELVPKEEKPEDEHPELNSGSNISDVAGDSKASDIPGAEGIQNMSTNETLGRIASHDICVAANPVIDAYHFIENNSKYQEIVKMLDNKGLKHPEIPTSEDISKMIENYVRLYSHDKGFWLYDKNSDTWSQSSDFIILNDGQGSRGAWTRAVNNYKDALYYVKTDADKEKLRKPVPEKIMKGDFLVKYLEKQILWNSAHINNKTYPFLNIIGYLESRYPNSDVNFPYQDIYNAIMPGSKKPMKVGDIILKPDGQRSGYSFVVAAIGADANAKTVLFADGTTASSRRFSFVVVELPSETGVQMMKDFTDGLSDSDVGSGINDAANMKQRAMKIFGGENFGHMWFMVLNRIHITHKGKNAKINHTIFMFRQYDEGDGNSTNSLAQARTNVASILPGQHGDNISADSLTPSVCYKLHDIPDKAKEFVAAGRNRVAGIGADNVTNGRKIHRLPTRNDPNPWHAPAVHA
jgi:hypothetical protein